MLALLGTGGKIKDENRKKKQVQYVNWFSSDILKEPKNNLVMLISVLVPVLNMLITVFEHGKKIM